MAWSEKYKNSINCKNPKGFSQRAHCDGKKKQKSVNARATHTILEPSKPKKQGKR